MKNLQDCLDIVLKDNHFAVELRTETKENAVCVLSSVRGAEYVLRANERRIWLMDGEAVPCYLSTSQPYQMARHILDTDERNVDED